MGSLVFSHLVSSVEFCRKIVMFSKQMGSFYECCDKNVSRNDDRRT